MLVWSARTADNRFERERLAEGLPSCHNPHGGHQGKRTLASEPSEELVTFYPPNRRSCSVDNLGPLPKRNRARANDWWGQWCCYRRCRCTCSRCHCHCNVGFRN